MNSARTWLAPFAFLFAGIAAAQLNQPFTPGNVVVYRVGAPPPSAPLSDNGSAVFLDEYTPTGTLVQSRAMPTTTGSGSQKPLVAVGSATGDGFLTRSGNGNCLVVPGYSRSLGAGTGGLIDGTVDGTNPVPRIVTIVGGSDTSIAFVVPSSPGSRGNIRGATSADCFESWISSSTRGMGNVSPFQPGTYVSISGAGRPDVRTVAVFGDQLYAGFSIPGIHGPATVGVGIPPFGQQADIEALPGLNVTNGYAFFLADLDPGVPGMDTLYVADEDAGLLKFSLAGSAWVASGAVMSTGDRFRGLTGVVNGTTVTLYATRGSFSTTQLVKLVDSSGFGGLLSGTPTVLATAASNTAFRGVAPAPEYTVTAFSATHGTVFPTGRHAFAAGVAQFTITPDFGYSAIVGGTCMGLLSGNTYTVQLVQNCIVVPTFVLLPKYTVTPSTSIGGAINPGTPQDIVSGQAAAFTLAAQVGYFLQSVDSTCGGSLAGNIFTTGPVTANCTVSATFAALPTYTVTPVPPVGGTIDPNVAQTVVSGGMVAFTLTPNAGYVLQCVNGSCGGGLVGNLFTTNPVVADCVVSPVFVALPIFTLTATLAGTGTGTIASVPAGITCPGDCSEGYFSGMGVELTATPAPGNLFSGWSGDCAGTGTCMVTMSATRNVTATFILEPFDITPDPFTFVDQVNVPRGVLVNANPITVSGLGATSVVIRVTGGEYSNGCTGTYVTTPAPLYNGSTVCVRHMSSASFATSVNTTLEIGQGSDTFTSTTIAQPPTHGDTNADHKADLFWRESAPSQGLSWWTMSGAAALGSNYFGVGSEWQIVDVGDLDGDGKADIVWRRTTDGATYLWTLDGLAPVGFFDLGTLSPAVWTLVGSADLNGDGKSDLVWRNADGTLYGWIMNGGTITSQGVIGNPGTQWAVVDLTDLNSDGKADLVFRNTTTGQVFMWFMNGLTVASTNSPGGLDPATWTLLAAADFNGDGKGDLLWRSSTGDTWVWLMNGASFVSGASIGNPGAGWSVKSVADLDGDGKADIVWRHADGTTHLWKMNGSSVMSATPITNPGGSWQIVAP